MRDGMGFYLRVVLMNLESGEEVIVIDVWLKEEDDVYNIFFFIFLWWKIWNWDWRL